jgi:putative intracellular protease/amidase
MIEGPLGPHPKVIDKNDKFFQIAILLYPGATALDAVGPWEVLSRIPNAEVRFVGEEAGPVAVEGGALLLGSRTR